MPVSAWPPAGPIVVTGATGGLGRHAVQALCAQGVAVRATGRQPSAGRAVQALGAQFVPLDLALADDAALDALLGGAHAVWHLAARSSPWGPRAGFVADNLHATERLLAAARRCGVPRFVHVSTPALYFDYQHRLAVPETHRAARFVNAYAATKAAAEQAVLAASAAPGLRSVLLRPRALFGPFDQVLLPRLLQVRRGADGRLPLPRGGRAVLDLTYVENVVHALQLATVRDELPSGRIYNISNHQPQPLRDTLARLFHHHLGWPLRIVELPYPLLAVAARALEGLSVFTGREPRLTAYGVGALHYDMSLSPDAARLELGYEPPVPLDEGLARTAAWLRQIREPAWPA